MARQLAGFTSTVSLLSWLFPKSPLHSPLASAARSLLELCKSFLATCRVALHLQLTTELIAAASGAASEAAPESMWQQAGASALQHAAEWSLQLLAALSDGSANSPKGVTERPASFMDTPVKHDDPAESTVRYRYLRRIHMLTQPTKDIHDAQCASGVLTLGAIEGGLLSEGSWRGRSRSREAGAREAAEAEEEQGRTGRQRCSCMQHAGAGARCAGRCAVHAGGIHRHCAPGCHKAARWQACRRGANRNVLPDCARHPGKGQTVA